MNIQTLFLSVFAIVILFFIAREDWLMLIPIPLAILNGYINSRAIAKHKVGKKYHTIQLLLLAGIIITLKLTNVLFWDELALVVSMYYATFEISLNLFNGQIWNYTGKTAWTDRMIRRIAKNEGRVRVMFIVFKLMFFFAGMTIYLMNKPL